MRAALAIALGLLLALSPAAPGAAARPAWAARPDEVRVGLYRFEPPATLRITAPGPWRARGGGATLGFPAGSPVTARADGASVALAIAGRPLLTGPALALAGEAWTLAAPGSPARRYAGRLTLSARAGRLLPTLTLPLEAYVASATGDEMPADWPAQALAAQAIAARSYAAANRGRHAAEGFDYCDLTHCQLFRGLASRDARVEAACAATANQVLLDHAHPIAAVWHSACNGRLAANDAVFGGRPVAYLQAKPDRDAHGRAWCAASPHARRWIARLPTPAVGKALAAAGVLGPGEPLRGLAVVDAAEGLPLSVRVVGDRPRTLTGYALWGALGPAFGWGQLASPRFAIAYTPAAVTFTGDGLGHLVGLCQWGARGRALAGWQAPEILNAYYPGVRLGAASTRSKK